LTLDHGQNIITAKGNLIHVTLRGAFNEYGARDVARQAKSIVERLSPDRFTILINMLNLEGATPEAFTVSNEFNEWLNKQNMIAKAIVIKSESIKAIDQQWVPAKKGQNIEYFENEEDAYRWLEKQLPQVK